MANVGVSAAATALFLAQGTATDAIAVVRLLLNRAVQRLENETRNSLAALGKPDANPAEEEKILRAWQSWYEEAFASVRTLSLAPASARLTAKIAQAQRQLQRLTENKVKAIYRGRK